jgi:hypothetical protein
MMLAACYGHLGRVEEARAGISKANRERLRKRAAAWRKANRERTAPKFAKAAEVRESSWTKPTDIPVEQPTNLEPATI